MICFMYVKTISRKGIKEKKIMHFTKMHGCGNDYIYINCFTENVTNPEELSRRLSDRHKGIGGDGIILIQPTETADAFMQLYNADGSAGSMCGNGIRCVAKYIYDHGIIPASRDYALIETPAGTKRIALTIESGKVTRAVVDMGIAKIDGGLPEDIYVHGKALKFIGVDVGNDHAVYFLEDNPALEGVMAWPDSEFAREGEYFETHLRFPRRVNSEFIEVLSRNEINMRVYERGSGETMACGTGATASVFAGVMAGKLEHEVTVHLRGGDLTITVEDGNRCFMAGPAAEVFSGECGC